MYERGASPPSLKLFSLQRGVQEGCRPLLNFISPSPNRISKAFFFALFGEGDKGGEAIKSFDISVNEVLEAQPREMDV